MREIPSATDRRRKGGGKERMLLEREIKWKVVHGNEKGESEEGRTWKSWRRGKWGKNKDKAVTLFPSNLSDSVKGGKKDLISVK